MRTTTDATRQMRASNPVPHDAFVGAAGDSLGQATFKSITASPAAPSPGPRRGNHRLGGIEAGAGVRRQVRAGIRSRWRLAGLAAAAAATLATVLAVNGAGTPLGPGAPVGLIRPGSDQTYQLDAFFRQLDAVFRAHPATVHGNAAAVLRQLASRAAAQPAPALGPVMYTARRLWEHVGSYTPRNLNFFSRNYYYQQAWHAADGAAADKTTQYQNGKVQVFGSSYPPLGTLPAAITNWASPATLPTGPAALRQYLLDDPARPAALRYLRFVTLPARHTPPPRSQAIDNWSDGTITYAVWPPGHPPQGDPGDLAPYSVGDLNGPRILVSTDAIGLMGAEPLPPAVRGSLLQIVADIAANPGRGYRWVDLGTITDRIGRTGVAVAWENGGFNGPHTIELGVMIFDPHTGALLDTSHAGCAVDLGAVPAARGECVPYDYTELLAIKAVKQVPQYQTNNDPNGPPFPF
jgi:hypothetical protein